MNALTTFDQSQLPEDVQALLHGAAERIRVRLKRTAEDIIEIGHDLLLVKERLEHGQFGAWLQRWTPPVGQGLGEVTVFPS